MAQELINIGAQANDGTGDTIRNAGRKINVNFTEFFALPVVASDIRFEQNNIVSKSSNADIVLKTAGTGNISFPALTVEDNNIKLTRSNDDLKITANGSGKVVIGGIGFAGTSIVATDSTIININENLIVDGDFGNNSNTINTGTMSAGSGSQVGNLTLANGSITDSSGAISFGNENITTTGTVSAGTGSTIGNLTLANGSITDSSGAISFGNENITTTGTLDVGGLTTLSTLAVTSTTGLVGTTTIDNLTFNDNTIGSSSNADINLTPGGTGSVVISNLTVDSNINLTDNEITTTQSNSDLVIAPAGTGQVVIAKADINGGAIDNTTIGGATPAAGTFTSLATTASLAIDGVTISDNTVSTNSSNANLELTGNGSGGVTISGFTMPTSDDSAGKFLTTNGLGVLSFATAGVSLSHSDLADASTTVASSATSVINTFDKTVHRSAKYFISASDATNSRFEFVEANVIHDGTTAYISTFGSVSDHTVGLATYSVGISGNNVQLKVTNITDNSTVFKIQRIAIDV